MKRLNDGALLGEEAQISPEVLSFLELKVRSKKQDFDSAGNIQLDEYEQAMAA